VSIIPAATGSHLVVTPPMGIAGSGQHADCWSIWIAKSRQ